MPKKFYVTTAIPYPNGAPHIGFGLEIIQADVLARYSRLQGNDTWFLTGTDEHGLKVFKSAQKEGLGFQEYVDINSPKFSKLKETLNISFDDFIRTTDQKKHWPGAQKLWQKSKKDIYLKKYSGLYCVGCEAFVKKKDLVDGLCPEHKTKPEKIEEENYFFRLSNYGSQIKELVENDKIKIVPKSRKNEVLGLLKDAEDFSVSRPKEKISWGIPVPDDPTQIQYVWFDALANYITAIGYGRDEKNFDKWWPADIHLIGKGVLRFHAIFWPAMLLSAGLDVPRSIYVHGYVSIDGKKISKSIGNVISPQEAVQKYGIDPVRYFLMREIPSTEDGDFSYKKLEDRYNGDLANNLGNLVSRTAKLIETRANGELNFDQNLISLDVKKKINETWEEYNKTIGEFKLHEALTAIWSLLAFANSYIDLHRPWAEDEDAQDFLTTITSVLDIILNVAWLIKPFMPDTSDKIFAAFGAKQDSKQWNGFKFKVTKTEPLFPRI